MKILFTILGRLGDVLMGIPICKALQNKHKCEITYMTIPKYEQIVKKFVDFDVITYNADDNGPRHTWVNLDLSNIAKNYDLFFFPQTNNTEVLNGFFKSNMHMIDYVAKLSGVLDQQHDFNLISDYIKEKKNQIIISFGSKSYPSWGYENFKKVCDFLLQKGENIVQTGLKGFPILNNKVIDRRGTSLLELLDDIAESKLYIGDDTGSSWLAMFTNTPQIVILHHQPMKRNPKGYGFAKYKHKKIFDRFNTLYKANHIINIIQKEKFI